MEPYYDTSFPDPDELPNIPWAPHLVQPFADRSPPDDEYEDDGLSPAPPRRDFLNTSSSSRQRLRREVRHVASDYYSETGEDDSDDDNDDENIDSYSAKARSLEIEDEGTTEDRISVSASTPQTRGRPRGRPRGSRAGRGRGGVKRQLQKLDEGLGLLSKNGSPRGRGRGRPRGRGRGQSGALEGRMPKRKSTRKTTGKEDQVSREFRLLHEEASQAFIQGDYDRAEMAISQAIEKNPEHGVHSLLAEILAAKGETVRAPWVLFAGAHVRQRDAQTWLDAAEGIRDFMGGLSPEELSQEVKINEDVTMTLYTQCNNYITHCYGQAVSLDRENEEIRKRRCMFFRDIGASKKAIRDYKWLLDHERFDIFRDTDALQYVSSASLEIMQPSRAVPFYEMFIMGRQEGSSAAIQLDWNDVNEAAELYQKADRGERGLQVIKKAARLLLGRGEEDFWDHEEQDDCEFDLDDEPRRIHVEQFQPGSYALETYGAELPIEIRVKLGLLRLQGNDSTEAMRHFDWLRYDETEESIDDFAEFYLEVSEALHAFTYFAEALLFFEPLKMITFQFTYECIDKFAECYEQTKQFDQAEELYLSTMGDGENDIVITEKLARMFSRADLMERAEPYMQRLTDERRKRLRLMDKSFDTAVLSRREGRAEVGPRGLFASRLPNELDGSDSDEDSDDVAESGVKFTDGTTFKNLLLKPGSFVSRIDTSKSARRARLFKSNGTNAGIYRQQRPVDEDSVRSAFLNMQHCQEEFPDKQQDWMDLAKKMVDVFNSQKVFHPYDKHQRFWGYSPQARNLSNRSKADQDLFEQELRQGRLSGSLAFINESLEPIPTKFCQIPFNQWLHTFLQLAYFKASQGKREQAYQVCQSALDANIFYHSKAAVEKIHVCWVACALATDDAVTITSVARNLMKDQQFVADAYRLYGTLNLVKRSPNPLYNSSNTLKFMLRQIKAMDWALTPERPRGGAKDEATGRAGFSRIDPETNKPIMPTEICPELLMIYATMLYAGQSHYESLIYMTRVYSHRPNDPLLNLLMGLNYIALAFKRQSENRQYQVAQGISLISRYHELRSGSSNLLHQQEVEYNMARSYQSLGLMHLSVPHYERCLEIGRDIGKDEVENFAIEAAYALQQIWAINGQLDKAEEITEEWLHL